MTRSWSVGAVLVLSGLLAGSAAAKDLKPGVDVLRWRRTYGEALREARLRNVPVLVTRHKDT